MKAKIRKWGNSLALRIPKSFVLNAKLRQDELVDLSIDKKKGSSDFLVHINNVSAL